MDARRLLCGSGEGGGSAPARRRAHVGWLHVGGLSSLEQADADVGEVAQSAAARAVGEAAWLGVGVGLGLGLGLGLGCVWAWTLRPLRLTPALTLTLTLTWRSMSRSARPSRG